MPFDKIQDARKAIAQEQLQTRQIADEQQQKLGYTRSPGFEPAPRARNPYVDEASRPVATGLSKGVVSTPEQEDERKRKAAAGRVLTNEDL